MDKIHSLLKKNPSNNEWLREVEHVTTYEMLGAYTDGYRSAAKKMRGVIAHVDASDSSDDVKGAVRAIVGPIAEDIDKIANALDMIVATVRDTKETPREQPPAPEPGQFKPNEVII